MTEQKPVGDTSGAQSVDRALALLSLIGRHTVEGIGLAAIVDESRLNRPTARRLLLALMRARMVEQDAGSRRYSLGEETYVLGVLAAQRFNLMDVALDSLSDLAKLSGDTAFLSVRRDAFSVCIHKQEGAFPIRTHALQVGYRHPLGVGAGSLAMLAALPDDECADVLARNAAQLKHDFPDCAPDRLQPLIVETRARGYSVNPGLVLKNSWAVGVALRQPCGKVAGAISIAAIDSRMDPARQVELGTTLQREAAKIESRLAKVFALPDAKETAELRRSAPKGGGTHAAQ